MEKPLKMCIPYSSQNVIRFVGGKTFHLPKYTYDAQGNNDNAVDIIT
jgi:hypothetical protein